MDNLLDKALSYLLQYPQQQRELPDLSEVLEKEQYILYFYVEIFNQRRIKLDRQNLEKFLTINAAKWINPRQNHRSKLKEIITKEYIAAKMSQPPLNESDYQKAFTEMILVEYDRLIRVPKDFGSVEGFNELVSEEVSFQNGKKILGEVLALINQGKEYKNNYYNNREILPYLQERLKDVNHNNDSLMSAYYEQTGYAEAADNIFIDALSGNKPLINLNMGDNVLNLTLSLGHHFSLIGAAKTGKTSLAVGEIVYPVLMLGHNVEYDSCEMPEYEIISALVLKHLYMKYGGKMEPKDIKVILKIHLNLVKLNCTVEQMQAEEIIRKKIKAGENLTTTLPDTTYQTYLDNREEFLKFANMKPEVIELVLLVYHDLMKSGKYGKLFIYLDGNKQEDIFLVDNIEEDSLRRIKEHNIKCLIRDHAGHYRSEDRNVTETPILKRVYKSGQLISRNKDNPVLVVTLNHLDTNAEDNLHKLGGDKDKRLQGRAYGTSESRKSCDLEVSLYATQEDRRDGLLRFDIQHNRHSSDTSMYMLVADLGVKDFYALGSKKSPYPEVEVDSE